MELVKLVQRATELRKDIGTIKDRYSRTLQASYPSNGCVACDALISQHFEYDAWEVDEETVGTVAWEMDEEARKAGFYETRRWGVWTPAELDNTPAEQPERNAGESWQTVVIEGAGTATVRIAPVRPLRAPEVSSPAAAPSHKDETTTNMTGRPRPAPWNAAPGAAWGLERPRGARPATNPCGLPSHTGHGRGGNKLRGGAAPKARRPPGALLPRATREAAPDKPPRQANGHARHEQTETPQEAREVSRRHPLERVHRRLQLANEQSPGCAGAVELVEGGRLAGAHRSRIATRRSGTRMERVFRSLGTMGGGNHFLELQRSRTGAVWLMLHSGSRGIGSRIGLHFIAEAKERIEHEGIDPPARDLAWLDEGSDAFERYFEAVLWAQEYARENRLAMLDLALEALRTTLGEDLAPVRAAVSCHHNYVERERHRGEALYVTRKGAIRAGKGELGIIPGSMGARSYIVRGLGNPNSFESAAHGAGRRMSRTEAKTAFGIDDVELQTEGVECRKDAGVIDELPGAYKDIDEVMDNQKDLVEILETLKQLVCVKG